MTHHHHHSGHHHGHHHHGHHHHHHRHQTVVPFAVLASGHRSHRGSGAHTRSQCNPLACLAVIGFLVMAIGLIMDVVDDSGSETGVVLSVVGFLLFLVGIVGSSVWARTSANNESYMQYKGSNKLTEILEI